MNTGNRLSPAAAAFEAFVQAKMLGDSPVAVIEGGYFDQRDPDTGDRVTQLEDSFGRNRPSATRPR